MNEAQSVVLLVEKQNIIVTGTNIYDTILRICTLVSLSLCYHTLIDRKIVDFSILAQYWEHSSIGAHSGNTKNCGLKIVILGNGKHIL